MEMVREAEIVVDPEFQALSATEKGMSKKLWVTVIRSAKSGAICQPCAICRRHAMLAHRHHLIPVSQMAALLVKAKVALDRASDLHIWTISLCPTHHALVHALLDSPAQQIAGMWDDLTDDEQEGLRRVEQLSIRCWEEFNKFLMEDGCSNGA